jgi:uncharacterized protein YbjT (DUF2867 family)
MKIAVIGGTGRIGDKVMTALDNAGHTPVAASPAFEVDAFAGEGLDEVMVGVDVIIDVSNAPAWGDEYVLKFFSTATRNLLKAGRRAGVRHHVALSVLGCDRLPDSGYMRAKVVQEALLTRHAQVPYTIVRSTQFMEFLARVADAGTDGELVRVPDTQVQPIAASDVAGFIADVATDQPLNGSVEIAGPQVFAFEDAVARVLAATGDLRHVVADPAARYWGATVPKGVLLPGLDARIARTAVADWLARQGHEAAV